MPRVPLCMQSAHPVGLEMWVWQSPNCRHDRNSWVFVQLLENNMTVLIFVKKKNNMWYIKFSYKCLSFPFPNPTTNQPKRGSRLPFKNRTWYFRGISKWPVKIKGVPRRFFCLQLWLLPAFHWRLLLNVVHANRSWLWEQHVTPRLTQEWLEGSLEKQSSFWEPVDTICTV